MAGSMSDERPLGTHAAQDEYYAQHQHGYDADNDPFEEYSEKPAAPPRRRFYKKKKYWIICSVITVIVVVVVVLLICFVFFPMIAQSLMNKANIQVKAAKITFQDPNALAAANGLQLFKRDGGLDPQSSFYMTMSSKLSNTGPFSASIKFRNPITVEYNNTQLGTITLPDTKIAAGKGTLDAVTPFIITDTAFFAAFSREMLARETFKWKLRGKLDISAMTRTATVDLEKEIELAGMNGFPKVKIDSFKLPGDDPQGGILMELGTVLTSPSPIGIELGTIKLAIGYDGVNLGTAIAEGVNLSQGDNQILLKGTLAPQNDTESLQKVGRLFSNYMSGKISNTTATGVSCAPNGRDAIGWLSEGFQSVRLNVALGAEEPLKIIHAVSMGYLDLAFDANAPYAPVATAPNVVADFSIPFGFSLAITEVQQNITLGTDADGDFAMISAPYAPAVSDQSTGKLQFAISNSAIAGLPGREAAFNNYIYSLTASDAYTFKVAGNASTKVNTPIGAIELSGISFAVNSTLHGMQFLKSSPTIINSLDVIGGTADALQLGINVTIENPSDFNISTGDVRLAMLSQGEELGGVLLGGLSLKRGTNAVAATGTFNPKVSDVGQNLLSTFVMGQDNPVSISGFNGSTAVASLNGAFADLKIDSTLPGLKAQLIQGSALTVLPETVSNGMVHVKVSIANPFSATLKITSVKSAVTYQGMPLGNIDQDISSTPIEIPGHATVESLPLGMQMNTEPAAVALLLRKLAVEAQLDTTALDGLLGMGGFHIDGQADVEPEASVFANFNVSQYVMQAMGALKADLQLDSGLLIGDYQNNLVFGQSAVQVKTDDTVTALIPLVGQPIVQQIVDGATLSFDTIVLSAPTNSGFKVQMKGGIANTGPMAAQIGFPQPLTISWQGKEIGKVTMPTVQAQPDVGATIDVEGDFTVSDEGAMAEFATFMINNDEFIWDIHSDAVSVNALGFTFNNIKMEKFVTLHGAQGFKNAVTIDKFDLPARHPDGGIQLIAETTIKNPSQIGFNLNGVAFASYFKDVYLGPLASDGAANFPPRGEVKMKMQGRLVPQDSADGLAAVTEVFDNFLNASSSIMAVKGVSGSGPNGEVSWLSTAFKTLTIENVVLPGPAAKPELIGGITMMDMQLDFTKEPYAPPASSTRVEAILKSPFGFPLGVSQLNMDVIATYGGNKVANLKVPDEKAVTNDKNVVTTQFSNVPFSVYEPSRPLFDGFVQLLTASPEVTFGLEGVANSIADTPVGALKLNNIAFNVPTKLAGFLNFGGKVDILSLSVVGGQPEYVEIDLKIAFSNPSAITITVGDLTFDTIMNEFQSSVGIVYLKDVVIKPGVNTFDAKMHMGGTDLKALAQMLSNFLTNAQVPLTISGTPSSTKIAPLQKALASVKLATTLQGLPNQLVESTYVSTTLINALMGKASTYVTLKNPLDTPFTVYKVQATIRHTDNDGPYQLGHIDYTLDSPLTVPAKSSIMSNKWPVSLDASASKLLGLLSAKEIDIDISQNVTVVVGNGFKGILYYYQNGVKSTLDTKGGLPPTTSSASAAPSTTTTTTTTSSSVSSVPSGTPTTTLPPTKDEATNESGSESKPASTPAPSPSASESSDNANKPAEPSPKPSGDASSSSQESSSSASETPAPESSKPENSKETPEQAPPSSTGSPVSSGTDAGLKNVLQQLNGNNEEPHFIWPFKI
ncbi:uncharacterized protein BYT42DRAFT_578204 [Radiomyces spectabilis]|uniref:uncharacterized protein n=1 Tax=Radiomyces spectabilis TaxID=64574 RepID=UPI0022202585|nr:uncharacterized protein BYT42DRAFT_578204 [Radiomyces spectabilis]KAI8372839.1 hypothetical protein BYT42DRAFT_578204 [Radiomyces spectabilis]